MGEVQGCCQLINSTSPGLQFGLRSFKALMKRLMTNVQRRYTSWNYKMWETVAYRGFEVRGRFPSSSHLKTYLFNIFISYQRGWCKRKTIPQRGTNGCKLSQMSHKDLDRGTKRSSPSDDRRGRRGVAEKGRK